MYRIARITKKLRPRLHGTGFAYSCTTSSSGSLRSYLLSPLFSDYLLLNSAILSRATLVAELFNLIL